MKINKSLQEPAREISSVNNEAANDLLESNTNFDKELIIINDSDSDTPVSAINLLFGEVNVKDTDLDRLKPGVLINDNILNSYGYICNKFLADTFVFDSSAFRYWQNNMYSRAISDLS